MRPCPACGRYVWTVQQKIIGVGPVTLAGATPKLGAQVVAELSCDTDRGGCGWNIFGYLDNPVYDPATHTFTGGHFIAFDPQPVSDD